MRIRYMSWEFDIESKNAVDISCDSIPKYTKNGITQQCYAFEKEALENETRLAFNQNSVDFFGPLPSSGRD